MSNIWWIALLLLGVWYWWDTLRTKEAARFAGLRACEQVGVQFLDDTVQRKRLWLRRDPQGHVQLCRLYFFEFSSDGARRYEGRIVMLGKQVQEVDMDAYRITADQ